MKAYRLLLISLVYCFMLNLNVAARQIERKVALCAYIYNFAKNIEWQNEAQINEYHFLIVGQDESLIQEMKKLSREKKLKNKPIRISSSATLKSIENVQLIFLTKGNEENLSKIFDRIEGKNILLVSDSYKDKRVMMINFFDLEKETLLFEINKANILNQHLRIMEDMILLGGTEIDVAALYQEGQQTLRSLQKYSETLENNLTQLKVSQNELEKNIVVKNKEVQDSKDSLKRQTQRIQEQQKILNDQSILLKQREKELENQNQKIQEKQIIYDIQTKKLNVLALDLKKGNELFEKQKREILQQKSEIIAKSKILANQGQTIDRQRSLVFTLVIIIVLVALIVLSIFRGYRIKKRLSEELEIRVKERTNDLYVLNEQLKVELKKRKITEENIQKLNQTLEVRVADRTAQLVAINKELESFSYSISHDLRAPLRAIFGFSQILSSRHRASLNEEGQQYMDYIVEASVRMEHLINDLLNYSRLGRKALDIVPISIGDIIAEMKLDFKQKLEEVFAELITDETYPVILGDKSLLRQIFINLIENAITYRRLEVRPVIRIHCEKTKTGCLIKVSDNGIGIPKEYSEKIFAIFQRLHSEEDYPGTGIGLATVRKAVSMLNGTIWVESVVGEGSTFIINMPETNKNI